jgi:hypothetical protein
LVTVVGLVSIAWLWLPPLAASTPPALAQGTTGSGGTPKHIYSCWWNGGPVNIAAVKYANVPKLSGARAAGSCTKFFSDDSRYKTLLGKKFKVYTVAKKYKNSYVVWRAKSGKAKTFGTWTFSSKPPPIPTTTKVLPASIVNLIAPPAKGGPLDVSKQNLVLTFTASSPQIQGLKPGNIIAAGQTPLTPDGLLRKITSITQTKAGLTEVSTVPAQIAEAVPQGAVDFSTALQAAALSQRLVRRQGLSLLPKSRSHGSICPTFSNLAVSLPNSQSIAFDGNACITGNPHFEWTWGHLYIPQADLSISGNSSEHLSWKYTGPGLTYSPDPVPLIDPFVTPSIKMIVGGIPVWVKLIFKLQLSMSLGFQGSFQGGVTHSAAYTGDVHCGLGGCTPSGDLANNTFNADPVQLSADATFNVAVTGIMQLEIDDVVGPNIQVQFYGYATGGLLQSPCWKVNAGFQILVGIELGLDNTSLSWSVTVQVLKLEPTTPIAQATQPCVPTVTLLADKASPRIVTDTVTFTATASTDVGPGKFHIEIDDASTGKPLRPDCASGTQCVFVDSENSPIEHVVQAFITLHGSKLQQSSGIDMKWQLAGGVTLATPPKTTVTSGTTVTLNASSDNALAGTGLHVVIGDDQGNTNPCASESNSCSWPVSQNVSSAPVTRTYTAWLANSSGVKVGPVSSQVVLTWEKLPGLTLVATPNRHDFVLGTKAHLILTSDTPVDGQSTFLKIIGSDGSVVASCPTGTTCSGDATSNTNGTVTYTGEVVDASGKQVDSKTFAINWFTFTITENITSSPSNTVPIDTKVLINMSASPAPAGFTLRITGPGGSASCPTSSPLNCVGFVTSFTPQTFNVMLQVFDDATGQPASAPTTQPVIWVPFSITDSASPSSTAAPGTQVTIMMSAQPIATGYTLHISGGGGDYACPTASPLSCSAVVTSPTAQSVTYTIYVNDDINSIKLTPQQTITITWETPCPNNGTECLVLTPSSGGVNSSFTATWQDESGDSCDSFDQVTFSFDGTPVGNPVPADVNGTASLNIQLNNASLGDHTVSITDSCGDSSASATYSVFGTGLRSSSRAGPASLDFFLDTAPRSRAAIASVAVGNARRYQSARARVSPHSLRTLRSG